jgi:site-specific DNA recombinase
MGGMRTAIGYVRKSNQGERAAASLEQQEALVREYCARHQLDLVAIKTEVQSASRGKRRPVWDQCLADLTSGAVGNVVVWALDRASRRGILGLAEVIEAVEGTGGVLHSVTEQLDLSTAMGQAMAGVIASMAKQESDNISLRVKRAFKAKAESGAKHSGGLRRFGVDDNGDVVESEAKWIRVMVGWRAEGWTYNKIATELETRKVPTVKGGKWTHASVGSILRNPRICGVRVHKTENEDGTETSIWYPDAWPQIISVEAFNDIQVERGRPNTRKHPQGLLTGKKVIFCGLCGGPMYDNLSRYYCRNGGEVVISQKVCDAAVLAEVETVLARIGGAAPIDPKAEVEFLRTRLSEWTGMFTSGDMDRKEWIKGKKDLEERLKVEEARLEVSERLQDAQHGNKLRLVKRVTVGKPGDDRLKVDCDYKWLWQQVGKKDWGMEPE